MYPEGKLEINLEGDWADRLDATFKADHIDVSSKLVTAGGFLLGHTRCEPRSRDEPQTKLSPKPVNGKHFLPPTSLLVF